MLVLMKLKLTPICDIHKKPMEYGRFGDPQVFSMTAYKCQTDGCSRVYNNSFGYTDIVNDHIDHSNSIKRECSDCETSLYLASEDRTTGMQTWQCAQPNCDYSEQFNPADRFKISVTPIVDSNSSPPYAKLQAVSVMTNAKWVGAALPWEQLAGYLSRLGQDGTQLTAIRENISQGMECQLVGIGGGELAVT